MGIDASAQTEVRKRLELAWAAGFFDGEGWAGATGPRRRRTKQPHAQINQSDPDGVPEVLLRFRQAVGVGRIGGPALEAGKLPRYWWVASSRNDVERTYELLQSCLGELKRAEFRRAVSRSEPTVSLSTDPLERRAWAAGLFDGEGSTSLGNHRTHKGHFTIEMSVTQSSDGPMPEALERFRSIVDTGRVYGSYRGKDGAKIFRWQAYTSRDIARVFLLIDPWLGEIAPAGHVGD